jgi:hypothetical protein
MLVIFSADFSAIANNENKCGMVSEKDNTFEDIYIKVVIEDNHISVPLTKPTTCKF